MKPEEFVDRGEQTKEGDKLVLFYNKTIGCAAHGGGRYLDSFSLVEPGKYCCDKMDKAMDGLHPVFSMDSDYDQKHAEFGINFISKYDVEDLAKDEDIFSTLYPINFCPFCGAEIVLKLKDLFQLKLRKEVQTSCITYKEKIGD